MRRWHLLALLLLFVWLYASVVFHLVLEWVGPRADPNFEHGFVVPFFALYVLWQDRKNLAAVAPSPSWAGLPLVVLSMLMLVLGILGADIFLPRVSLLILLAGLVILFLGWTFFRALLFPWAFLFLMIPIPALLINRVTFPLQLVAAKWSAGLLELVGVPVLLEGNLLSLASKQLNVAEACSGIRSLLTLITLAIIYGYLLESRKWVRVVLVCAAIPIAVAANSVRIFGTGLLIQYHHDDLAEGFYHTVSGTVIFAVALIMLFALHRLICFISQPDPAKSPGITLVQEPLPRTPYPQTGSILFGIVAAIMLVTAITLQARSSTEIIPPHPPLASLPRQIDDWKGSDESVSPDDLKILGNPEYLLRTYEVPTQDQPWFNLYIVYFPSQRAGDTIHSPEHCLPGAGWIPTLREVIRLPRLDGSYIPVNRYVVSKSSERQLVLYWFQAHGRVVSSEWRSKYYLISDSIHMHRSDGGMVRLMTPMLEGESPEAAQARMMKLASQIIPLLDSYIPL